MKVCGFALDKLGHSRCHGFLVQICPPASCKTKCHQRWGILPLSRITPSLVLDRSKRSSSNAEKVRLFSSSIHAMGVLEESDGQKFVRLANGRRICYREDGVPGNEAKRQLMVLHGIGSSRLSGIPGVSKSLLRAYGVRLVAIDRPGYGRSDIDPAQTLQSTAEDIKEVADALCMGDKIWLLGLSAGGAFSWAFAHQNPHRLAGVALWAPVGNFRWKGISDADRRALLEGCASDTKLVFGGLARRIPNWALRLYAAYGIRPGVPWLRRSQASMPAPDKKYLLINDRAASLARDNVESMVRNRGFGLAKDIEIFNSDWGFEPEDVANGYQGPLHIWQGTEDNLVPVGMQRWVQKKIPDLVKLHELENEGHLSWFCNNSKAHHKVFTTLFGEFMSVEEQFVVQEEPGMEFIGDP